MSFLKKVWTEAEPVAIHAGVILIVISCLIVVGGAIKILESLFPKHQEYFILLEMADIWLVLTVLSMFGAYTFIQVAIRLWKGIKNEWNGVPSGTVAAPE